MSEDNKKIKELLDVEFLKKLTEIGKIYGWQGDYYEIGNFIIELHKIVGIDISHKEIKPYKID